MAVDLSCGVTRSAPGEQEETAAVVGVELPHYEAATATAGTTYLPDDDEAKVGIWPWDLAMSIIFVTSLIVVA